VYRERSGPGFMKSESEWTVTRFDPPHELVHASADPSMPAEATWTLEEVDVRSTKVTQALGFEMLPRFRPLGRLLEAAFAKRFGEGDGADIARPEADRRSACAGDLRVRVVLPKAFRTATHTVGALPS
jgi:hypothetical protein